MPSLNPDGGARRVGLLGGSFNPAHEGHLEISRQALEQLRLDEVWWLVSPQNPLKTAADMAPFEGRVEAARALVGDGRIRVTGIECELGTRYTRDTVCALKGRFPAVRFVWIMGADNLAEVCRWKGWPGIFRTVAIAVFARPSYSFRALSGRAARRFRAARQGVARASRLADMRPPAWVFLNRPRNPASATRIRARRQGAI
ncbi:MAG: nicotinate-nucleotide adenylyltransferase [Rhodospirillales bacterium]|nr:nicotinate-nucleotide adenylyltransferase [Rhodospirillales bacterium]HJO71596.1 nicotinate-nucleotide adenylyltransferase [Rhodospirillales bacterium]